MTPPRPWLPYVVPFALYMGFVALQGYVNLSLAWMYPVRVLVVTAALVWFRNQYEELRPNFSWTAVAVGLAAIVIWIGIDPFYPYLSDLMGQAPPGGARTQYFDPSTISSDAVRLVFFAFRIAGASLVVPLMEELFWRGFLIRWIDNPNFKRVPIGAYSFRSFALTTLFFGFEHEQWLAGIICGALYNALLYKRKDLFSCVLAHGVSNFALAVWVLSQSAWRLW